MQKDGTPLRILVVDDEPLILYGIEKILNKFAEVKTVGSAEDALEEIETQHYDLCLLDVILPGMNGLEAMKIINKRSPNTKVAIMTGSSLDEDMHREINELAYEFVEKPFELSRIRNIAEKVAATLKE